MNRKFKTIFVILIVTAMAAIFCKWLCHYTPPPPAQKFGLKNGKGSTPTTMTFGNRSRGGGCSGKGICSASISNDTNNNNNNNPILVTFYTTDSMNVILMVFSMDSLIAHQPEQAQYFKSGSYMFEVPYSLSPDNPVFTGTNLALPPSTIISPTSPSQVIISGDSVVDIITYTFSQAVTTNIIFGDNTGGAPNYKGYGIIPNGTPKTAQTPTPIPVTFTLLSGNASKVVMSFKMVDLLASGPSGMAQANNFKASSYIFADQFSFADPSLSQLGLPTNAMITSACASSVGMVDGVVSDTISYITP